MSFIKNQEENLTKIVNNLGYEIDNVPILPSGKEN